MLKKILLIAAAFIGILIIGGFIAFQFLKSDPKIVLDFIEKNPSKSAILLVRNDTIIAERNADRRSPLASTVKIIIGITYARQCAAGKIAPTDRVRLSDIARFFVADTDGGAHLDWLESLSKSGKIAADSTTTLRDVARGMLEFSSNANSEFLMEKLGLAAINAELKSLGATNHDDLYPFVSALFLQLEFPKLTEPQAVEKLRALSRAEYIARCNKIHAQLLADADGSFKRRLVDLPMPIQRVWSDSLPASTPRDYVSILKKINSRSYFDAKTQQYLSEILEVLMENLLNQQWLAHAGMKGGSTAWVLTKAIYATDKKSNRTELAYFFNDLTDAESDILQQNMNAFELNVLRKADFRQQIAAVLK